MNKFYIDVAPLQEVEYTGIPQVAAKLCEQLLSRDDVEPAFFYNRHEVPIAVVEQMLAARSGQLFRWAAERYCLQPVVTRPKPGVKTVGLHTNMKFARRLFPIEGQIVHDLTTVVTPQYHTAETNDYHVEKFYGDLMSNDVTFCVSQSTAVDVAAFYTGLPGPLVVSHLGVDWDHVDPAIRAMSIDVEPFILVLGTIEPRKNLGDVLDLLAANRMLARSHRFVFGGRTGWGDAFEQQVAERGLSDLLNEGRLFQTGFVSEAAKYLLFRHASAVIYPSVYEGFGLPVAEAISLETPVITTPSSSLPEVGGELAHYFVPGDLPMLRKALAAALKQGQSADPERGRALSQWRDRFSWSRCFATIHDALFAQAASSNQRDAGVYH